MSATLPNLPEINEWIQGNIYMTDFRPVEINEYVKVRNQIFTAGNFVSQKYSKTVNGMEYAIQEDTKVLKI
jgi:replicative superfamily II helicase